MNGPVPVFAMRDQAIAPRFDSRPAWWIFREILHRMGIKEALDFETIEELWNYQLDGTGVTVAEMRETGIVGSGGGAEADPARRAHVPDARRGRSRSRARSSSRPGLRACRRTSPRRRRRASSSRCCSRRRRRSRRASRSTIRCSTRERPNRCSGSTPTVPRRSGSPTATRWRSTAVAATPAACRRRSRAGSIPRRCSCCTATAPRCRSPRAPAASASPTSACSTASSTTSIPAGGGCALTETVVQVKRRTPEGAAG